MQTRSFFTRLPQHIASAQKVITQGAAAAKKAHEVVQHINKGVQSNDVFGDKVKKQSEAVSNFSDLGLQKISTLHKGADQFLGHLAKTPGIG